MDEPVPRRSFVRRVATDAVRDAGRLAGWAGAATGMVAHGMAELASAADPSSAADRPSAPAPAVVTRGGPPTPTPHAPTAGRLDDDTRELLATADGWSMAANRRTAGPLVVRVALVPADDHLDVRTRAGSALALAVGADGHVTLLHDDHGQGTRTLVFGSARVLEGAAAEDATGVPLDADQALIRIAPGHAIRMPQ